MSKLHSYERLKIERKGRVVSATLLIIEAMIISYGYQHRRLFRISSALAANRPSSIRRSRCSAAARLGHIVPPVREPV